MFVGAGLSYAITSNFLVNAEYTVYDTELDADEAFDDIDDTDFKACESYGFTGLTCGSDCLSKPGGWCRGRVKPIPCGPKNISTTDKRLCGNPLVFAKDPCLNFYSNPDGTKTIKAYGRHTVRKKDSP